MKELKVGERVTLEVTKTDKESCKGCFFDSKMFYCEAWRKYPCSIKIRSDHKSVIFKEVKRMKQKLKMIWRIIRDKQVVVITESYGRMYYNWDTRSLEDVCQMCHRVCETASMMNNKK